MKEATNKFPKWWEDDPRAVLTKVYHAKRQLPPKLSTKEWQKLVNVLNDRRPAPLADYRRWSKMDPAKIQSTGSMKPKGGKQSARKHDMSDAPIKGFNRNSSGKVVEAAGEEGTDELISKYRKDTPGQNEEMTRDEKNKQTAEYMKKTQDKYGAKGPKTPHKKLMRKASGSPTKKMTGLQRREKIVGEAYQTPAEKKAERLAKIDRAAKARVADQEKSKAEKTAKHNQNSAKTRAAIKYRGNKDQFGRVREDIEITESDKAEYDKLMKQYGDMPASKIPPKTYMRISLLGRKVRGDKGGPTVGDLLKSMKQKKMGESAGSDARDARRQSPEDVAARKVAIDKGLDRLAQRTQEIRARKAKITKRKKGLSEESIKINGGSAVEIGKIERGSKTQYYWKDKSGLKNVFDTPQKLRYSLRNDANFSGAEKAVKQLLGEAKTPKRRLPGYKVAPKKKEKSSKREWDRLSGEDPEPRDPEPSRVYKPKKRYSLRTHDQVDEAKMGDIRRNVKKGDSPYTVVAIVNNKVVDQDHAKIPDQVPALVRELKKEYPNAKISVEDRGGRVIHSESFEAGISEEVDGWVAMYNGKRLEIPNDGKVKGIAGAKAKAIKDLKVPKSKIGMLAIKPSVNEGGLSMKSGRTPASKELAISRLDKRYFGSKKSLKDRKRDAHKAERKKGKQDVIINPEMEEAVENPAVSAAKRGVDMARKRVVDARTKLNRTKERQKTK